MQPMDGQAGQLLFDKASSLHSIFSPELANQIAGQRTMPLLRAGRITAPTMYLVAEVPSSPPSARPINKRSPRTWWRRWHRSRAARFHQGHVVTAWTTGGGGLRPCS